MAGGGIWKLATAFGGAATAGFALAAGLILRAPHAPAQQTASTFTLAFDQTKICTAPRENVAALTEGLTPAPFMSLDVVNTLTKSYTGSDPHPVSIKLTSDPDMVDAFSDLNNLENLYIIKWFDKDGQVHRDDGPAITVFDAARQRVVMDLWVDHGSIHRDGNLPASTQWDEDGRVKVQEWRKRDKLHNTPGPAYRSYDWKEDIVAQGWYLDGNIKRAGEGPSYTESLMSSGITILERYEHRVPGMDRMMHRHDGLHIIKHDKLTGFQTYRRYLFHAGESHADEMTYEIHNDGGTGLIRREEWKKNGHPLAAVDYHNGQPALMTPSQEAVDSLRQHTQHLIASGGGHHHHHHDHTDPVSPTGGKDPGADASRPVPAINDAPGPRHHH